MAHPDIDKRTKMYEIEYDVRPDSFKSIPAAMYQGMVTLATVGYGTYPVTVTGKIRVAIIVIISMECLHFRQVFHTLGLQNIYNRAVISVRPSYTFAIHPLSFDIRL